MAKSSQWYRCLPRNWIERDQSVEVIFSHARNRGLNANKIHEISGVASGTVTNWFDGKTRRPQNATLCAVTTAMGIVRRDRLDRDGTLIVDYAEARAIDYEREREKQANHILKNGTPKQKQAMKIRLQSKRGKRKSPTNGAS